MKFQSIPTLLEIFYFAVHILLNILCINIQNSTLLCPGHVKICENFCYCHITLMGSEYGVHMSILSYFTNLVFGGYVDVHFYCLLQNLSLLLCTHSLPHPRLSTEGSGTWTGGPALHPLWSEGVRRIGCVVCCVETWGVRHGPGILFSGTPLFSGLSARHRCSTALPRTVLARVDRCTAAPLR